MGIRNLGGEREAGNKEDWGVFGRGDGKAILACNSEDAELDGLCRGGDSRVQRRFHFPCHDRAEAIEELPKFDLGIGSCRMPCFKVSTLILIPYISILLLVPFSFRSDTILHRQAAGPNPVFKPRLKLSNVKILLGRADL